MELKLIFTTLPGSNVLVLPNPPLFTIAAVSNDYLMATNRKEVELIGQSLFEVFPNNPSDPHLTSEKTVRASLEYALVHKQPHYLPVQRYDVILNGGTYEERYWSANNKPVINKNGDVVYLIHHIEDVTEKLNAEQRKGQLKGIEKAFSLFMHAPMVVGLVKGDGHVLELANDAALKLWGKTSEIIGKPLLQEIPELAGQGIIELFDEVKRTGQPFFANEVPVRSLINGKEEIHYFNLVYQPFFEDNSVTATGVFTLSYDVTEAVVAKKEIEEAKKGSERQKRLYETINGSTPDLIYVFDLNYRFTYANKALLDMWGKTLEQSIGKGLLENGYELWHAEMHEREIDQVVATKQPIRGEVSFPHATLGKRVYDYIFVPVINDEGEVEAVAGTTRDITEIKLAEQTTKESEERFRKLADESPMFVFIINADPTAPVTYWNKTWLQYTGQSLEEALGRAWSGIIHPEDVQNVMERYTPAFQNKTAYFIPYVRVKRHDGVYRWHAFKGNPRLLPNGDFAGFIGVGLDINEQKLAEEALMQSEAKLRNMILHAPVAMCVFRGKEHVVEIANDSMLAMWGKTRQQVIGKPTFEGNPEGRGQGFEEILETIYRTGEPYHIDEIPLTLRRHGNMEHFYTNLSYDPIKEPDGTVSGILVVGVEVTEQVLARKKIEDVVAVRTEELQKANEALLKSNKELARSNADLEEFAYAASHDMKEPIRKLLTFADRLKSSLNTRLTETEKQLFERMETSAGRMTLLIDDLLEFSHATDRPLEKEEVDLNDKLKKVIADFEILIDEKKATITVGSLPVIKGYRRQLQQLFTNLIGNALKYNKPNNTPEIVITSTLVKGNQVLYQIPEQQVDRTFHLIEVRDNGIGFEPQYGEKIFSMFQRLHGRAEYPGTGVGLSIARKVVTNHEGYIWAEAKPDEGATFKILFPA